MLMLILGGLLTSVVAYIVYTIISSNGSEFEDNSIEAFIRESTPGSVSVVQNDKHSYNRQYAKPGKQILIIYGTEYGFSEEIARLLFDRIEASISSDDQFPWQPRIVDAKYHEYVDFNREHLVFIVISTAGDGIPPTEARSFCERLETAKENFGHLNYSVLALGDTNYPHFCRAGQLVDDSLKSMGCHVIAARHEVDMEDWGVINAWLQLCLDSLSSVTVEPDLDYLRVEIDDDSGPSRTTPFLSKLMIKRNLTISDAEADKETIHCEFDLRDSGLEWTSGDALGIYPQNKAEEVDTLLSAMGCSGTEAVDVPKWAFLPKPDGKMELRKALLQYYDLKTVRSEVLQSLLVKSKGSAEEAEITNLLKDGTSKSNTFLHEYLYEREVADVLQDFPSVASKLSVGEVLSQMKGLQPRYYSISSSPVTDTESCCVTAAIVRYSTLGRSRTGVTTTFLQDRLPVGMSCPVFISQNPEFRLPESGEVPIIMVGPGTGIAPFRAFIQERVAKTCAGSNRLYFGCRHRNGDFLYKDELEKQAADGVIELRKAFSRDQPAKIYVQDLIREDAALLWKRLDQEKCHVYICGDAKHMAHDVNKEFLAIIQSCGGKNESEAAEYLSRLEVEGRYQKDVWVT